MVYFLIILIVFLAVVPILHFLPSRRQKLIIALREAAFSCGLYVEYKKNPIVQQAALRLDIDYKDIIFYGRRLPNSKVVDREEEIWTRDVDRDWKSSGGESVPIALRNLPGGVVAAMFCGTSCGVYWTEYGEIVDVKTIAVQLEMWQQSINLIKKS